MNAGQDRPLLGHSLIAQGLISSDQLDIALAEQQRSQGPLGQELIRLGFIDEHTLRKVLAVQLGHSAIDLALAQPCAHALALLPRELALRHCLLPLAFDAERGQLSLVMADPGNLPAIDQIRSRLPAPCQIQPLLGTEPDIRRAIERHYSQPLSIDDILAEIETGQLAQSAHPQADYQQPMVRLLDAILADALHQRASDIHFEPEDRFLRIRYRIDGVLRQIRSLHKRYWPAMLVRLKVLAGMNITESRSPQDGRFSRPMAGREPDFRLSALPTLHGENLVLRILDRQQYLPSLSGLGLSEAQQAELRRMQASPEGIILLSGPTGSGKTTTLYALLHQRNHDAVNIMTLEDPVEYPLPRLRQTAVSEQLGFADGIRAILRQDPDIILVGEIRDHETAEMAFRAALTGHQVYTTLHSNSAVGAIARLLDLGVRPDIMAGNLIGIVAQRLVRRLCPHCRRARPASAAEQAIMGDHAAQPLHEAVGCAQCQQQGYLGRLPLIELLSVDEEFDALIATRATSLQLRQLARRKGLSTLRDDGLRRVAEGLTSLEELARVVKLGGRD